jgi:O-antigen ligase
VAIFIALNLAGLLGSSLLKTTHMKNMESTQQKIETSVSESEFEPSSLAGRKLIWRKTIERIAQNKGLGSGPDSLSVDMAYAFPTAHNLFLTLGAEYGLPGALLIIIFLLVIADRSFKSILVKPKVENNLWLLQAVFVAASFHSLFVYSFDIPIHRKQLWFMLGLLMASLHVAAKYNEKEIKHHEASHRELTLIPLQRDQMQIH